MKRLIQIIYSVYALTLFAIFLIPALVFYLIIKLFVPYKLQIKWVYKVNYIVILIWSPFVGFKYKCIGKTLVNKNEPYILVVNHNNLIDLFIMNRFNIVSGKPLIKDSLLKIPLLGWLFQLTAISIDRNSKESKNLGFNKMLKELKMGISILIFPEGTRNRTNQFLSDFRDGAFKLSIESNVKILPAVILNTTNKAMASSLIFSPGLMVLKYLSPIDLKEFDYDYNKIKNYCYKIMEETIIDYKG